MEGFKHHNLDDGPSEEGCSRELRFIMEKTAVEYSVHRHISPVSTSR